jgi:hypothetical protein
MKRILVSSLVALFALSGAAFAAEANGMAKDTDMGKHMMSSKNKDNMSTHMGSAMKDNHGMKSGQAMKGAQDKAMSGKHKMKSETK